VLWDGELGAVHLGTAVGPVLCWSGGKWGAQTGRRDTKGD